MSQKTKDWLGSFRTKAVTIAITSGKGGVGKTSIALKLAKNLSRQKRVLLIDCDYNLSNTLVKLKVPLNNNFYEYLRQQDDLTKYLYQDGNFHLFAGCNGSLQLFNDFVSNEIIIKIILKMEQKYDYIILDCPAGMPKDMMILSAYCDHRIFVVTPDKSSITDSYSLIKILNTQYGVNSNYLLANRYTSKHQFKKLVTSFSRTVEKFLSLGIVVLGGIREIDCFSELFDEQFLYDDKNVDQDINKIIDILTGNVNELLYYSKGLDL